MGTYTKSLTTLVTFCLAAFLTANQSYGSNVTELNVVSTSAHHSSRFQNSTRPTSLKVSRKQIEESSASSVAEVLQQSLGLTFTATGGSKAQLGLFLRGNGSEDVLVLIDGVPANDPSTLGRQVDFGKIPLRQVDSIEVIKGPQSGIYGSDALGGVVLINTKKLTSGNTQASASVKTYNEYGFSLAHAFRVSNKTTLLSSLSADQAEGFSAAKGNGFDKDGFNSRSGLFRLNHTTRRNSEFSYQFSHFRVDEDIDDANIDDPDRTQQTVKQYHALSYSSPTNPKGGSLEAYVFHANHRRDDIDPETPTPNRSFFGADSTTVKVLFNKARENRFLTLGFEADTDAMASYSTGSFTSRNSPPREISYGIFFESEREFTNGFSNSLSLRHDFFEKAEDFSSLRIHPQKEISENTNLFFTYSTGSKHPSLDQRFNSLYGTADLKTQSANYLDLGLNYATVKQRWQMLLFWQKDSQRIDYNSDTNKFENIEEVEQKGAESSFIYSFSKNTFRSHLNYVKAKNKAAGRQLARRPEFSSSVELERKLNRGGSVSLGWNYVTRRFDNNTSISILESYHLLNASYRKRFPGCGLSLQCSRSLVLSVKNIADTSYELVKGYSTPGRTFSIEFNTTF